MAEWTDAPILYFHFNSAGGEFASLPMRRVLHSFPQSFTGVPGTFSIPGKWFVPGYQCLNCGKLYFAARQEDLKHECMSAGSVASGKA